MEHWGCSESERLQEQLRHPVDDYSFAVDGGEITIFQGCHPSYPILKILQLMHEPVDRRSSSPLSTTWQAGPISARQNVLLIEPY